MGDVLEFKRPKTQREKDMELLIENSKLPKNPNPQVLHLMTQRDQPYGSVRRCCERCGRMIVGTTLLYTTDEFVYNHTPPDYIDCRTQKKWDDIDL